MDARNSDYYQKRKTRTALNDIHYDKDLVQKFDSYINRKTGVDSEEFIT